MADAARAKQRERDAQVAEKRKVSRIQNEIQLEIKFSEKQKLIQEGQAREIQHQHVREEAELAFRKLYPNKFGVQNGGVPIESVKEEWMEQEQWEMHRELALLSSPRKGRYAGEGSPSLKGSEAVLSPKQIHLETEYRRRVLREAEIEAEMLRSLEERRRAF
jgi:hypothetical protein